MSLKATRGAGCSWGMAEEAGGAVSLLESYDLPGVDALASLLETPRACHCAAASAGASRCGLAELTRLSDLGLRAQQEIGPVVSPLLLCAPLLLSGDQNGAWSISWQSGQVTRGPSGVLSEGTLVPHVAETVSISMGEMPVRGAAEASWKSRVVSKAAWQTLETYAARTYVPETDASRAAGAGPDGAEQD